MAFPNGLGQDSIDHVLTEGNFYGDCETLDPVEDPIPECPEGAVWNPVEVGGHYFIWDNSTYTLTDGSQLNHLQNGNNYEFTVTHEDGSQTVIQQTADPYFNNLQVEIAAAMGCEVLPVCANHTSPKGCNQNHIDNLDMYPAYDRVATVDVVERLRPETIHLNGEDVGGTTDRTLSVGDEIRLGSTGEIGGKSFDVLVVIDDIQNLDDNGRIELDANPANSPNIVIRDNVVNNPYIVLTKTFVEAGTTTPCPINCPVSMLLSDVDSGNSQDITELIGVETGTPSSVTLGANLYENPNGFNNTTSPSGFTYYGVDPSIAGNPDDWVDEINESNNPETNIAINYDSGFTSGQYIFGSAGTHSGTSGRGFNLGSFETIKQEPDPQNRSENPAQDELWATGWIVDCGDCNPKPVSVEVTNANNSDHIGATKDFIVYGKETEILYRAITCGGVFYKDCEGNDVAAPECCPKPYSGSGGQTVLDLPITQCVDPCFESAIRLTVGRPNGTAVVSYGPYELPFSEFIEVWETEEGKHYITNQNGTGDGTGSIEAHWICPAKYGDTILFDGAAIETLVLSSNPYAEELGCESSEVLATKECNSDQVLNVLTALLEKETYQVAENCVEVDGEVCEAFVSLNSRTLEPVRVVRADTMEEVLPDAEGNYNFVKCCGQPVETEEVKDA